MMTVDGLWVLRRLLQVLQEPPPSILLPPLLAPPIRRLGVVIDKIIDSHIVRNIHKHILLRIELVQLLNTPRRLRGIVVNTIAHRNIKRLRRRLVPMNSLKHRTRTHGRILTKRRDRLWQRQILRRSELGAMMRDIAAHEDEFGRIGAGACKTAHVADSVAGRVEEVEAAVAVEVEGVVLAEFEALAFVGEGDFAQRAAFPRFLVDGGVLVCWPAGDEGAFEAGADDEVGGRGEGGWVACVVLGSC